MIRRRFAALVLVVLVSVLLIATPTQTRSSKFVLSEWDQPDEYGQGIYLIRFYENSTGSWVAAPWYYVGGALDGLPYYALHPYDPYDLNWSEGVAMKLRVYTAFNQTQNGVGSTAEGQRYLRHNVTVTEASTIVFSQQNFTYYDVTDGSPANYYYEYEVILNFLPIGGSVYSAIVTYEIFWGVTP